MPRISERRSFGGAEQRIARLGLGSLFAELEDILTGFELALSESRDDNSAGAVRAMIDERFIEFGGWESKRSGGVDWTKCAVVDGIRVCLGVEIQFSGRSDLLIVDVVHLREALTSGDIDVGVIATSADPTAYFLTDRVARYSDAEMAVGRARAEDLPLLLLGLTHDGPGPPLAKQRTRQGRPD